VVLSLEPRFLVQLVEQLLFLPHVLLVEKPLLGSDVVLAAIQLVEKLLMGFIMVGPVGEERYVQFPLVLLVIRVLV